MELSSGGPVVPMPVMELDNDGLKRSFWDYSARRLLNAILGGNAKGNHVRDQCETYNRGKWRASKDAQGRHRR